MNNKVYVVRCPDYESTEDKLRELFEMMGGIARFAAPGEKIILKVNLLRAAKPEEAVSTHPAVARGVARIVKEDRGSKSARAALAPLIQKGLIALPSLGINKETLSPAQVPGKLVSEMAIEDRR